MNESNIKPNGLALLPILVFLILFLGTGIILKDFYTMPAVVGFLIALIGITPKVLRELGIILYIVLK